MDYPWYTVVENSDEINQGDLLLNCPTIIPPNFNYEVADGAIVANAEPADVRLFNAIVVTQSCDLENGKVENVLMCPYLSWTEYMNEILGATPTAKAKQNKWDELRKGNLPGYHLINRDQETALADFQVVDFRNVFAVNYTFLKSFAGAVPSRHRLLPPYREHLSQAFARFFMRVGLPIDIEL
jgi:hypothetical protein